MHFTRKCEKSSSIWVWGSWFRFQRVFPFLFSRIKNYRKRTNSFYSREKVIWRLVGVEETHAIYHTITYDTLQRKIIDRTHRRTRGVMFYTHKTGINSRKLNWLYEPIIMLAFDVPDWVSSENQNLMHKNSTAQK